MPSPSDKITVGIIGCGRVAEERHCPALSLINNVTIVAAADSDSQRLQKLADQYSIPQRYTDYRDLIRDPEVDIVAVLTPTATHVEIGLAVMEADKHLFLEKPLALTTQECDTLVNHSKTMSSKSMICFNMRWHRLIQQARAIITEGKLGKIVAVRSEFMHYRDGSKAPDWHRVLAQGGGVTFNEAVHHIDLWRHLLGVEVKDVFAFHSSNEFYQDVSSVLCASFSNDAHGSIHAALKTSPNNDIEIIGEKGRLYVNLYRFDGLEFIAYDQYPGNISMRIKRVPYTINQFKEALLLRKKGGDFQASFYNIWKQFIHCIQHDEQPTATLEDGKHALQISQAAIESYQTNNVVHLTQANK